MQVSIRDCSVYLSKVNLTISAHKMKTHLSKLLTLSIGMLVITIVSCHDKTNAQLKKTEASGNIQCDTNFIAAIKAIERDSFLLLNDPNYNHHLNKCENSTHNNCFNSKYIIISTFLEKITIADEWPKMEIDSIFTRQEINQYQNQDLHITTICYPNYTFVDADSANCWLDRSSVAPDYIHWIYQFSKPLISKNKRYMLIEMTARCGRLCGGFQTFILEKKENNWYVNHTIIHGIF